MFSGWFDILQLGEAHVQWTPELCPPGHGRPELRQEDVEFGPRTHCGLAQCLRVPPSCRLNGAIDSPLRCALQTEATVSAALGHEFGHAPESRSENRHNRSHLHTTFFS